MYLILLQEVKDILHSVVLRNMMRESLHIKKESFEAWRRVVEVTLASCPADILPKDTRQTVIADILQDLLSKVHVWPSQLINFNSQVGSFSCHFPSLFLAPLFLYLSSHTSEKVLAVNRRITTHLWCTWVSASLSSGTPRIQSLTGPTQSLNYSIESAALVMTFWNG